MNIFINDAKSTSGSILDETKLDYVSLKLYVFGRKMKLELSTSKSRYSEIYLGVIFNVERQSLILNLEQRRVSAYSTLAMLEPRVNREHRGVFARYRISAVFLPYPQYFRACISGI